MPSSYTTVSLHILLSLYAKLYSHLSFRILFIIFTDKFFGVKNFETVEDALIN